MTLEVSNSDIMKVLMKLQNNIETEIKPAIDNIEKKLSENIEEVKENLKKNINEVKEEMKNNAKVAEEKMEKINLRMNQLEERNKRTNYQKMKATGLIPLISSNHTSSPTSHPAEIRPIAIPARPAKKSNDDNFSTCLSLNWNENVEEEELARSLEAVHITTENEMT